LKTSIALDTEKQVGMHLRNKNIENDRFDEDYSHRSECERVHNHIKWTILGLYNFVNKPCRATKFFLEVQFFYC